MNKLIIVFVFFFFKFNALAEETFTAEKFRQYTELMKSKGCPDLALCLSDQKLCPDAIKTAFTKCDKKFPAKDLKNGHEFLEFFLNHSYCVDLEIQTYALEKKAWTDIDLCREQSKALANEAEYKKSRRAGMKKKAMENKPKK